MNKVRTAKKVEQQNGGANPYGKAICAALRGSHQDRLGVAGVESGGSKSGEGKRNARNADVEGAIEAAARDVDGPADCITAR